MLKITESFGLALKAFTAEDEVVGDSGVRADETIRNLFKSKKSKNDKSKNLTCIPIFEAIGEPMFLISDAKEAFNHLRQVFIKASIF